MGGYYMQVRGYYMQVRNDRRQVHSLTSEQGREVDAMLRKICEIAESVFFQKTYEYKSNHIQ